MLLRIQVINYTLDPDINAQSDMLLLSLDNINPYNFSYVYLQVYKGLDIVTNKVTKEEQAAAKHHLIDFVSPLYKDYNVTDFKHAALPIVSFQENMCSV